MIKPESKLPFHILNQKEVLLTNLEKSFDFTNGKKDLTKEDVNADDNKRLVIVADNFDGTKDPHEIEGVISDNKRFYNSTIYHRKDAEFIVHACNNYEKLVNQLKDIIHLKEGWQANSINLLKELGEL